MNGYVETMYMYVYRFESEVKAIRLKMDSISGKKEGGKKKKKMYFEKSVFVIVYL